MIKAVIFDLDGTLADTTEANARAYAAAFQEVGINVYPKDYYPHHGKKWDEWGPPLAGSHAEYIHKRKAEIYEAIIDCVQPNSEIISQWYNLKGKCITILITNASSKCAHSVINKLKLSFDHEFYGKDYSDCQAMLKDIASCLELDYSEILLIDDSEKRLRVAGSLGMEVQSAKIKTKK